MSNYLRAGFKERHHKRLHEAINMTPTPTKRTCPERVQEESVREVPQVVVPPSDVLRSSSVSIVERETSGKEAGSATGEALGGAAPADEALDKKDTPALGSPPSWDEMMEMLNHVSCFIDVESPSTKISDFFPPTK